MKKLYMKPWVEAESLAQEDIMANISFEGETGTGVLIEEDATGDGWSRKDGSIWDDEE